MNHPPIPPNSRYFHGANNYEDKAWFVADIDGDKLELAIGTVEESDDLRRIIACVALCAWQDEEARLMTDCKCPCGQAEINGSCPATEACVNAEAWRKWGGE